MIPSKSPLTGVFASLSAKQRQVMELLSEGRTSKEIAWTLGISESAAIQRIESVRAKAGGLLRKELAREYRLFVQAGGAREISAEDLDGTCNDLTGKFFQLPPGSDEGQSGGRNQADKELVLADAIPFEVAAPWASRSEPGVVPEVLDGRSAALSRLLAATGIAVGLLVACLVMLAVAGEIGRLV